MVKTVTPLLFSILQRNQGGIPDWAVTCASAEVSAQLIVQLPRTIQILSVIPLKHRHDETRSAIPTLGSLMSCHRLLYWVGTTVLQSLNRHHLPIRHEDERGQTTVD